MHQNRSVRLPPAQEWVNKEYERYLKNSPNGDDVLAGLNMFWAYFNRDSPRKWHPAFYWGRSLKYAAAIMGLNWKSGYSGNWQYFRPKYHYIAQMREYGIEEDRETGWLKVTSLFRWKHALWLARQTGRCPPSTFAMRISDPDCEPTDPVDSHDLPPKIYGGWKKGPFVKPGLLTTAAKPDCIEKEMHRIGHGDRTFDARRERFFATGSMRRPEQSRARDGQNPTFAQMAKSAISRIARS